MKDYKCPCEDCISLAICRHKNYTNLVEGCILLLDTLYMRRMADAKYRKDGFVKKISSIDKCLKPTEWKLNYFPQSHEGGVIETGVYVESLRYKV